MAWSFVMSVPVDELVERVLDDYRQTYSIDDFQLAVSRERVGKYIAKLSTAGRRDPQDLTVYAKAYLKELREGPDPHSTGC
jgi:hypothetical protein